MGLLYVMAVSIDSKLFYRGYRKPFYAQLAVSVEIFKMDEFEESYRKVIEVLDLRYGLAHKRSVITSRFLVDTSLDEASRKMCIKEFVKGISEEIGKIYVIYTSIPPSKIPVVKCYNGKEEKNPTEFIRNLTGTYTHCVLWKLLDKHYYSPSDPFLVDFFEGDVTDAWEKIVSINPKAEVFFSGDECNPAISTADLICKFVEYELSDNRLHLGTDQIKKCFSGSELDVEPIFLDDLSMITPRKKEPIIASKFIHHPIVFVFGSQQVSKEKEVLKSVGMYDNLINFAFERKACLKFFNYDSAHVDARYMSKGDIFVP
ncbi:MAG: hypothetical protein QXZ59_05930, partial [Nitrososphaeria archaeon]